MQYVNKTCEILERKDWDQWGRQGNRQAVLYALAIKFLKEEELVKMKEVFSMTVLGEM